MNRRLNMVFLGCGAITATHSRTLARFRDRVRCFYASRDPEKAMGFERRFGGGGSYGSYEAALADGRIEVAFVATPPASHLELTLEALEGGKDVIVEKPAFLRAGDCDRVAAAAADVGRRVFVAENYCYKPLAATLRTILAWGAIGEVRFLEVNALRRRQTGGWRDDPCQAGGGALFEGGIHWVDLVAHLGLAVRAVQGFRPVRGPAPERSMLVLLQYEGGAVGILAHSWETAAALRGLQLSRIRGTEGSIVFESNGLFILLRGRGGEQRLFLPGLRDIAGYHRMFDDLLAALEWGGEPFMTLARARRDIELVEAAYASAEGVAS